MDRKPCLSRLFTAIVKAEVFGLRAALAAGSRNKTLRLRTHRTVLGPAAMVPSEEVKESVREELGHLHVQGDPFLAGLPACGGNADYDVPKKRACSLAEFAFSHPEGEDIGGFVFLAIESIELLDLSIGR